MELTAKQQITELVRNSKRILLCMHANPDGDALGSALALYLALKKIGKDVALVSPNKPANVFKFLPSLDIIKDKINAARDFIISVSTSEIKVDKLSYKNFPEEGKLNIILTPQNGKFNSGMVSFHEGSCKCDLVIVLDSPDLDRLKQVYDQNSDLFYEVPVINIDHHPGNDHFGQVNWIDLTATSTAEILVSLLESLGRDTSLFDPDIATCLLTGLITDTGSFQNSNTTPKSFTVAAQLIAAGARQQEIIRHIYKTKPLSTLKLWGKALSYIKEETEYRFIWSALSKDDFSNAGANEDEAAGVVDELLKTVPGIDFALLITEKSDGVHASLRSVQKGVSVSDIARIFGGGGHELAAAFQLANTNLYSAQKEIIDKIKSFQAKKLNLDIQNSSNVEDFDRPLEMPPVNM
jgi:phosphoesterase RecJ-like protein